MFLDIKNTLPTRILRFIFGSLVLIVIASSCTKNEPPKQEFKARQINVDELLDELEKLTEAGKYPECVDLLNSTDVERLIDSTVKDSATGKVLADKLVFLAYETHAPVVPGLPNSIDYKLDDKKGACISFPGMVNIRYTTIPGMGDVRKFDNDTDEWYKVAPNFALRFNARIYRMGIQAKIIPKPDLSEHLMPYYLNLDEKTWNALPIEVQVILLNLLCDANARFKSND